MRKQLSFKMPVIIVYIGGYSILRDSFLEKKSNKLMKENHNSFKMQVNIVLGGDSATNLLDFCGLNYFKNG